MKVSASVAVLAALAFVAPDAAAAPEFSADSLILNQDDMRRIAGDDTLVSRPEFDVRQPTAWSAPADIPDPCRATLRGPDTFAAGWQQYRAMDFTSPVPQTAPRPPEPEPPPGLSLGPLPPEINAPRFLAGVDESVAIYPDDTTARAAYDALVGKLRACAASGDEIYDFVVRDTDPATATLVWPNRLSADLISAVVQVKSAVLSYVSAGGFPHSQQVAQTISQDISARIP